MGYVLGRLILVTLGFILAIAAASTVIVLPQWLPLLRDSGMSDADTVFLVSQWFVVFFVVGTMAFPLASLAIIVCEILLMRAWAGYAIIGACIAFTLSLAVQRMQEMNLEVPYELAWLDFRELLRITPLETLAAGLSAGLAYWLIAGRPIAEKSIRQKHDAQDISKNNPHTSHSDA